MHIKWVTSCKVGHVNSTKSPLMCVGLSITCNRENSIKAAISVRQMQPVTHLNLVPLAPGKVHKGATNVAAQLEHVPVDVKILAIAAACQTPVKQHRWATGKNQTLCPLYLKKKIQLKSECWSVDAYQCQRQCSQAPGPPGTAGPSARLCSGYHWNTELSFHRRCGRGLSRAGWQPLPSCLSLMQGPHRVAPEWTHTHTHISIHHALWWLLHFIRKKEAVTTPPVGVSQWCFCTIKFRWKPLIAERFEYPSPNQKRIQRLHSSASSWCSRWTRKPFLSDQQQDKQTTSITAE